MPSLKQKTLSGMIWSSIENVATMGVSFVIGIVLARLLTPKEYGIVGMTGIFLAISQTFINSGFTSALIRKPNCSDIDYSTVFYFNLVVSLIFYALFFLAAPSIGTFFEQDQLPGVLRVIGITLIIDALTLIQGTILTRRVDFKTQTRVSLTATILSGILGIAMAYSGFGIWSLVARSIAQGGIRSVLLWIHNRWIPLRKFSRESFQELFSFGSKILASSLLDTLWKNIHTLVIAKYFSAASLGQFSRAVMFRDLPSANLTNVISRVSYPVLAKMQHEPHRLRSAYRQLITTTVFISSLAIFGMAAVSENMVLTLLGEAWRPSIPMLQLLCLAAYLYPLHALNLNLLNVMGRSDLFLRLEIIKKLLGIPVILIGIFVGLLPMIAAMVVNSYIAFFLNSYYSGRLIGYSTWEQIMDVLPSIGIGAAVALPVYGFGRLLPFSQPWQIFTSQILLGGLLALILNESFRIHAYTELKMMGLSFLKQKLKWRVATEG